MRSSFMFAFLTGFNLLEFNIYSIDSSPSCQPFLTLYNP